jgi:hypothetical protein
MRSGQGLLTPDELAILRQAQAPSHAQHLQHQQPQQEQLRPAVKPTIVSHPSVDAQSLWKATAATAAAAAEADGGAANGAGVQARAAEPLDFSKDPVIDLSKENNKSKSKPPGPATCPIQVYNACSDCVALNA